MTHKKKDCMEVGAQPCEHTNSSPTAALSSPPPLQRPRKVGAKFTGKNICADEHMQPELSLSWDGKRDRWEETRLPRDFYS